MHQEVLEHQEVEVLLEVVQVVLEVARKSSSNHIVTKEFTSHVERKICCVPRTWYRVKASMVKRESRLM